MKNNRIVEIVTGRVDEGSQVVVAGWVRTRRDSKGGFSFVAVHDGSCFAALQIVAPSSLPNYADEILHLTAGCSVIARGTLVKSQGKGQAYEVQADAIEVVGKIDDPDSYPISPKQHSLEYLREVAHLRPRTNTIGAVARVRHTLSMAVHRFFDGEGFYWIHTPIITSNDAEGAGAMFRVSTLDLTRPLSRIQGAGEPEEVKRFREQHAKENPSVPAWAYGQVDYSKDFFGRPAHLTVSGQLNVECYAMAMSRVYTFGPTFRAENSNTPRHLAEFWMIEPEIAFADLAEDAALAERFLKYLFKAVLDERADDLAFFVDRVDKECVSRLQTLVETPFEQITYTDAIARLQNSGQKFEFPVTWGIDLQTEHERYLTETLIGRPTIVTDYPKGIKAFYMKLNDDGKTVRAMDVLAPGIGEIIGGSQREDRLDVLDARMTEMGLSHDEYNWYRDLRRYGTVPHAGFGLGFERAILYTTGMANIRDVIPFPRTPNNCRF
jgi:asparaginyl-tRNA synthetase